MKIPCQVFVVRWPLILVTLFYGFGLLGSAIAAEEDSPLPPNPADWACYEEEPTKEQIDEWCKAHPDRGVPMSLGAPSNILDLGAKNEYDQKLTDFVINKEYEELGWLHDNNWRMTGPVVGKPGAGGKSYGVHPAVKIYYSPEIIDWMCTGRKDGAIPDGAMIIKEMHDIGQELALELNPKDGCMDITAPQGDLDTGFGSWTIMIKDKKGSYDGWYWANPYKTSATGGNPPILDRTAFAKRKDVPSYPTHPDPNWYPTGNFAKIPNVSYPYNGFGVACLNCHVSAKAESTFSSLENLMGEGLRYKGYDLDKPITSETPPNPPFPKALPAPNQEFLTTFNQMHQVSFVRAWDLRLPAETYDHVVSKKGKNKEFLTSDQCIACHDATMSNSALPNMMFKDENKALINLSMYGEWRVSPMGLAGRDPIFFSQLQSETNNLPTLADCIENTCLHCHGVLGQRQYSRDTDDPAIGEKCRQLVYGVQPPEEVPQGNFFSLDMVTKGPNNSSPELAKYGALARDGISCMSCHQMEADEKGSSHQASSSRGGYLSEQGKDLVKNQKFYTGNFVTTSKDVIYGPIKDEEVIPKPMEHVIGITPKYGKQITNSQTCGNCHNILLPEITQEGDLVGHSFEQSTHLEWENSVYAQPNSGEFKSCQGCHMPHKYEGKDLKFKVANIESDEFAPTTERLPDAEITLKDQEPYPRHALHGLNIFLNQMFQQFPVLLGLRQTDYMTPGGTVPSLVTGQKSMLAMSKKETATVEVDTLTRENNKLTASIIVNNKAGHYLPSGVGFRRIFVEFLLQDKDENTLWASGRTNSLGQILDGTGDIVLPSELPLENPKEWQPHHLLITKGSQVQIYQEVILDSNGDITTSFLRRIKHVKDNRIRPEGFDPKFFAKSESKYIRKLAEQEGKNVKKDRYYSNPKLTGADRLDYIIKLSPEMIKKAYRVKVTLYNQSIPPGYLQQRFRDANRGPAKNNEIQRLFYLTSHLNVDATTDYGLKPNTSIAKKGKHFIKDWKLQIGESAIKQLK